MKMKRKRKTKTPERILRVGNFSLPLL